MKIPAIKGRIGDWDYYVTVLTFNQVNQYVSKIDDQLHQSDSLKDLIQRSITDNYVSIKDYILKQPELFFNSLVLAVYDDYPDWSEIEFKYGEMETYQMGLLNFPGVHRIFPVDGQHRVEGIKEALKENPDLGNEKIAAIFIGHSNKKNGKRRTRRLFSTLNRYAKPVTLDDIIALDEDDCVAIVTRELLEEYDLFTGSRVVYAKQKAIPTTNKDAITSIITLYQANREIYKRFYETTYGKKITKQKLEEILKFRPSDQEFAAFKQYCFDYWDAFKSFSVVKEYLKQKKNFSEPFRNNDTGGNLIFRPIGLLPLVKATIYIETNTGHRFKQIVSALDKVNFEIDSKPWVHVLWNPIQKSMIMNSASLTERLIIYLYNSNLQKAEELRKLKEGYAARMSIEDPAKVGSILKGIK